MASPFISSRRAKVLKRRQSELPSDLIDWDAPVMPEIEKQRIVYETYIQEMKDDILIENIIRDQIQEVAFEVVKEQLKDTKKELADAESKINLLLNQLKMAKQREDEKYDLLKSQLIHFRNLAKRGRED